MKKTIWFAALGIMLAGCSGETVRDVDYYKTHKEALEEKLAECVNNPGALKDTPNCVNARTAKSRLILSSSNKGMPSFKF